MGSAGIKSCHYIKEWDLEKKELNSKSQCSGGNKAEGLEMGLLVGNTEQNFETSGSYLRDVTL